MQRLLQDIHYAFRFLCKAPGFTIPAVLTLALGMGANTVMFSVLNTVLLRPLPYPRADRLVQIWETAPQQGEMRDPVSPYNFLEWRKSSQSFSALATYDYAPGVVQLRTPTRVNAEFVTSGFFDVFGVGALKGRTFRPGEDDSGNERVAVMSYGAWSRYFDRDPNLIDKSIMMDGHAYSVVGIMGPDFSFPNENVEMWCLPGFDPKSVRRGSHFLSAVGRLKPGVKLDQAAAEMNTIADSLNRQDGRSGGVHLIGLQDEIVGNVRQRLLILWIAVLAVLLIACANVAGLLLSRAVSRQKEVAIRTALGVSRGRLVRQLLTESLLLATMGGVVGLVISYVGGRFLIASTDGAVPRLHTLQIDGWVLGFTVIACMATGLIFGIAPTMHALRLDLHNSLKESGIVATKSSDRFRLRRLLVIGELTLAMVLLVGGGLLSKTLWKLQQVDPGFQTQNILSFRFSVANGKYDSVHRAELYQRLLESLAAIPGVESVGATNDLPFGGSRSGQSFEIEGRILPPGQTLVSDYRTISPDFMQTMRIRLLAGREFAETDTRTAPYVAIVNEAFLKNFLSGEEALGKRLRIKKQLYEVVGVVADVKQENLAVPGDPEIYVPYSQADPANWTFIVVRSRIDARTVSDSIRNIVQQVAPDEPIYRLNTMTRLVEYSMTPQRFSSLLLVILAALAVVLAAIGIYGLISYSVAQRRREIGIRMALGADRNSILRLVLRQGTKILAFGLAAGTLAAYLAARALRSMLFGVGPHDPQIFFGVASFLILVVILATYVPARRATSINPLAALRDE